MKRENFIYPSFFIKETKEGIYSTTYPVRISEYNFSFDDAINKWKFWHPNTQILFTSNDYLSKQSLTGGTYREYLLKNITRLNISENPEAPLSYPYKFTLLPITFTNNSKDSNPSYSYRCDDLLLDSVRYYDGKIIWFSTNETTLNQGQVRAIEYVEWWEETGRVNFNEFERYKEDIIKNEPPYENPYRESDSWMDDSENYWNID